ncbi:MAG: bifunctional alpha/beta hydrolase/OsmC family protein [Syntrophobacteraceae bacterium]|jgi:putative redox protein|nr:bifunctional alpha/beta hydrolase/OsmC family protein [Syntrophobacteraceae bacterium]
MRFLKLDFRNAQGDRLSARLDLPLDEKPAAYALFAHCFTCNKNFNAVFNINRALANEGIAVLRFDFTGLGESEGDFSKTSLRSNVEDLITAADFLKSELEAPKLLIGHSLGGAAVLQAASKIPSARAVATIAAPFDPSDLGHILGSTKEEILQRGEAEITLAGRTFVIRKQFLDDLEQVKMDEVIRSLGRALMVFHSPRDTIVSLDNAARIFQAAKHPKSFVSLDEADHLLSNRGDSLYAGKVLAAWVGRYLDLPKLESEHRDLSDNRVMVRTGKKGFQTEVIAGGHRLLADEPVSVGGADTGPNPYDYLVASLGACTSMTLRMYADRKKWPLEAATIRLRHKKVHAEDCEECEAKSGTVDVIEREIDLDGDLDQEQRQRLLEIADRCPVHRTLHSRIEVMTSLKD